MTILQKEELKLHLQHLHTSVIHGVLEGGQTFQLQKMILGNMVLEPEYVNIIDSVHE